MALNLASPGIQVREVDLTIGRVDATSGSIGAIVAPFTKGPVEEAQLIESEEDLLQTFGQPYSIDNHYEYWMVASSFLAYGGTLQVIRADDFNTQTGVGLKNAFVGTASSIRIKSDTHYNQLGYDDNTITGVTVASKTPGTYANGLRVAIIDAKADQVLTVSGISTVGLGITQSAAGRIVAGAAGTSVLDGYIKGVVTGFTGTTADVKVLQHVSTAGTVTNVNYQNGGVYNFATGTVSVTPAGQTIAPTTAQSVTAVTDWFEQQNIVLTQTDANGNPLSLEWDQLADRPGTSTYAAARGGRFDELHVVVIDDKGTITGNAGTILEKHLNLSKAKDAEYSVGSTSYWRKYLATNSQYIYGGSAPAGITTSGFTAGTATAIGNLDADSGWDQDASEVNFGLSGVVTSSLTGGTNYGDKTDYTTTGALTSGVDDLITGYGLFENKEEIEVDFILMGAAHHPKEQSQAIAEKIIAVAEARKDAVAFVSPYRQAFLNDSSVGAVTVNNIDTMTNNIVGYYAPITSTTYGVFDSGYKYMFDRFNNTFRYVPLNGDIAGTCARTDVEQFPWFSPAGTARGAILNSVKLVYNPGKKQRDILYSNRVNPVILSPGAGIILFGDKTGFGKSSAFDRINVRRLFIFLEDAISAAAKDQLFEFNDELTRTNFVNIIEPFLREVQSNRGIFDFVVICDETNNTAAVIDRNEFVADIFIKPARSINFIGLTFVATRTGVDFEEVIGSV
jgi:phage tail sheath protein FI